MDAGMKTARRGEKRLVGRPEKCPSVERARERGERGEEAADNARGCGEAVAEDRKSGTRE